MAYLFAAIGDAFRLIATFDRAVVEASGASMTFALVSTAFASILGIPVGVILATSRIPFQRLMVASLNALLAIPTVVVGLFAYAMLNRQGPVGSLGLLFTPWAIIVGQTILIVPLVTALVRSAVASVDEAYVATARTLGAGRLLTMYAIIREARAGILVACVTAFGRVIGEVGVSMMLGGNIAGFTRTITTVIALETAKGEFALALALGIILLAIAFVINIVLQLGRTAHQ
ncbi:MAG: ABC transporter permease [Deltaproteobacteria bacterium RIFOXYA12_FULL_58_15]|nr:MAG: ABC transporter permease [Deltaproteobacteria bacterium RIFOXYA12_FULL_58_15]OGR15063.1 MAG: ABC transporter permease [Deltaproteobacteria bacterium RIFOXYB12_FULL_58_9]